MNITTKINFNPFLGSARGQGAYFPFSDHLELPCGISRDFLGILACWSRDNDFNKVVVCIEEFVHRGQFFLTQFGLVYRLLSLCQSVKVSRILAYLGTHRNQRLAIPWLKADKIANPFLWQEVYDLRALCILRNVLLGATDFSDAQDAFTIVAQIFEQILPVRFFAVDCRSQPSADTLCGSKSIIPTTHGILESHASAYALSILRAVVPLTMRPTINAFIQDKRRGLYCSIEEITQLSGTNQTFDLDAVLAMSEYALDSQFLCFPGLPAPPQRELQLCLPQHRYFTILASLPQFQEAATIMKLHPELNTTANLCRAAVSTYRDRCLDSPVIFDYKLPMFEEFLTQSAELILKWADLCLHGPDPGPIWGQHPLSQDTDLHQVQLLRTQLVLQITQALLTYMTWIFRIDPWEATPEMFGVMYRLCSTNPCVAYVPQFTEIFLQNDIGKSEDWSYIPTIYGTTEKRILDEIRITNAPLGYYLACHTETLLTGKTMSAHHLTITENKVLTLESMLCSYGVAMAQLESR